MATFIVKDGHPTDTWHNEIKHGHVQSIWSIILDTILGSVHTQLEGLVWSLDLKENLHFDLL